MVQNALALVHPPVRRTETWCLWLYHDTPWQFCIQNTTLTHFQIKLGVKINKFENIFTD